MLTERRLRRPRLVASFLAVAALLALAACSPGGSGSKPRGSAAPPPPPSPRPNIVFVLTDDLSTNLVGYMPHVRALADAGTTFANYFVVDSLCCPSRSAIFTGEYPHNDGVFTNGPGDGGYDAYNRFGNEERSFAVPLQADGYRTGFMGKYLNGYQPHDAPAPGWDVWDVAGNGYPEFNYRLRENNRTQDFGAKPRDYLTDVLGRKAARFIHASRRLGKPFVLEVATFAPHKPLVPAPRDRDSFPTVRDPRTPAFDTSPTHAPSWLIRKRLSRRDIRELDSTFRLRVEEVQAVDRMIGTIEHALAVAGELRNTYIVFSSDNGYHLGEYRLLAGKQTAYDTDIKVPLVVAGPGVPAARTVRTIVSSIDLAPTFLAITGTRPRVGMDGVSVLPLLHGQPAPRGWQQAVLIEHHGPVLNPHDPDVQPFRAGIPPSYEAMRTRRFLYVEYAYGGREYYDLRNDPYELHNLAGSLSRHRRLQLHAQLRRLELCSGTVACQRAARLATSG
jgi:arylsulfatase A-like enzyme